MPLKCDAMKTTNAFYADIAVIQFTYWFNNQNNTKICAHAEYKAGVPFVEIDFKDTSKELIFKYTLRLGEIQNELSQKEKYSLDYLQYPLPPKEDEKYRLD